MTSPKTFASIIPLIGGMTLAGEQVLKTLPSYILSYTPFGFNDSFLNNYYEKRNLKIPYHRIDEDTFTIEPGLDLVTSLCPCAGLSAVSTNAGTDNKNNQWMYTSTEYVLQNIRPKFLIGENAPRLFLNAGQGVAKNLKEIADKYGYQFQLVKTNTLDHGLPQNRIRTYFVFSRDTDRPLLLDIGPEHHKKSEVHFIDYLANFPDADKERGESIENNPFFTFLFSKFGQDLITDHERFNSSFLGVVLKNGLEQEAIDYFSKIDTKNARSSQRLVERAMYKPVWDASGYIFRRNYTPAIMWRSLALGYHPTRLEKLTTKETMRLMGLPEDFDKPEEKFSNVICQNVPIPSAKWIIESVMNCEKVYEGDLVGDGILRLHDQNGRLIPGL